jgi:hypothetical protein
LTLFLQPLLLLFTGSLTGFVSITAFTSFLSATTFPEPFLYNWLFCRSFCFRFHFAATIGGTSGVELTGAATAAAFLS